jgi:hypothetical protein
VGVTTITLKREGESWIAHHRGGRAAAEIQELFGTLAIPTAFTDKAEPETVRAEIRRLNQDAEVLIAD